MVVASTLVYSVWLVFVVVPRMTKYFPARYTPKHGIACFVINHRDTTMMTTGPLGKQAFVRNARSHSCCYLLINIIQSEVSSSQKPSTPRVPSRAVHNKPKYLIGGIQAWRRHSQSTTHTETSKSCWTLKSPKHKQQGLCLFANIPNPEGSIVHP